MLLCCTVYLPGFFSIPPVDRDESRFAQASRQMFEGVALPESERDPTLHAGGLVIPMVAEKPRLNKPPLIYWLQAASAAVFTGGDPLRDAIWMYRVPSLLAGFLTVLATWRMGLAMFDPRAALLGAALLAVSPVFVWEAHQARADMVMVAFTTLAMWQLHRIWRAAGPLSRAPRERAGERATTSSSCFFPSSLRRSVAPSLLLWLCTTLGILTKGPITPLIVVLTALTLSLLARNFRWLRATRPVLGLLIIGAGVGPWVYLVAERVGFAEYWSIVTNEFLGRAGAPREGHWGPPGYHTLLLVVLFWPGSLLTALAIGRAWRKGVRPASSASSLRRFVAPSLRSRPESFFLAWLIPSWILFELSLTKLPHYTMPLYPAVALITARAVFAWPALAPERKRRALTGAWLWLVIALVLVVLVGVGLLMHVEAPFAWLGLLLLAAAVILLVPTSAAVRRCELVAAQHWSLALAALVLGAFLIGVAPGLFGLSRHGYTRAAALAEGRPLTWVGFTEDSIVWFARGRPSFTAPADLTDWFDAHPDGLAVVSVYAEDSFRSDPELWAIEHAFGVHYSKGRLEKLAFVERLPPAEPRP